MFGDYSIGDLGSIFVMQGFAGLILFSVYVLMALGSFGVILLASRAGFESDELEHFKGLSRRDPTLALAMMMLMFSTAGVPPLRVSKTCTSWGWPVRLTTEILT